MKRLRYSLFSLTIFILLFALAAQADASEGTTELRSTNQENYRCYVSSLQMQDYKYRVLVSCRNLVYPADSNLFNYILWAVDKDNGEQIKFGALGLGRASFATARNFSTLFVTTERNSKTKEPTGSVVMQGNLEPIDFLQVSTTPTPTIEGEESTPVEVEIQKSTNGMTTRERLLLGLRRAGVVSLLALVAIIGLVFVITRSRS